MKNLNLSKPAIARITLHRWCKFYIQGGGITRVKLRKVHISIRQDGKKNQVRRASQGCNGYSPSDGNRKSRRLGEQTKHDALGANSQHWLKPTPNQPRPAGSGGIISQLIEETEYQLAEYEEQIEQAIASIEKYKERVEQLKKRKQELLLSLESWKADVIEKATI